MKNYPKKILFLNLRVCHQGVLISRAYVNSSALKAAISAQLGHDADHVNVNTVS